MSVFCVGCNREIARQGTGPFCYTCPCGATLFVSRQARSLMVPTSLIGSAREGKAPPHIDYYVGKSNVMTPLKAQIIEELRKLGAVWSWECEECRDRVVKRTAMELQEGFYPLKVHEELAILVTKENVREP